MKTSLQIIWILSIILLQVALLVMIVEVLHPFTPEECRHTAKSLSSGKTPFASASRYFYTQAKRNDRELESDLETFQRRLAEHDYHQADMLQKSICERYPEYSNLAEQLRQNRLNYQKEETDNAATAFQTKKYDKALSHLQNADKTVPAVPYMYGYIHLRYPKALDYSKARKYLETALEQGDARAAFELGSIYETGKGVGIDLPKAISYYEGAFEANIKEALPKLAELCCMPEISDKSKALKYNQLLVVEKDAAAMFRLAELMQTQDNYQDSQWPAVEGLYRQSANMEYRAAMEKMASLYLDGKISAVNVAEQEKCYLFMAENEHVEYQLALAELYSDKILNDKRKAFVWFQKAADNGNVTAIYQRALCYEKGIGIEANLDNAVKQYRLAAQKGHPEAKAWIQKYDEDRRITAELLAKKRWLQQCFADFQCCAEELTGEIALLDAQTMKEKLPELTDLVIAKAYKSKAYISGIGMFSKVSYVPLERLLDRKAPQMTMEDFDKTVKNETAKKLAKILSGIIGVEISSETMALKTPETVIHEALQEVKYPLYKIGDYVNISLQNPEGKITIKGTLQQVSPYVIKISGKTFHPGDFPSKVICRFYSDRHADFLRKESNRILQRFNDSIKYYSRSDLRQILIQHYIPNVNGSSIPQDILSKNSWETVSDLRSRVSNKIQQCFNRYAGKTDFSDMIKLADSTTIISHDAGILERKIIKIDFPGQGSMYFTRIPSGSFIMGSPLSEKHREDDEQQHKVTLDHDYWFAQFEVTQEQFTDVMNYNPSDFKGARLPVDSVTWYEANDFCHKMNRRYGSYLPKNYEFALPTEAQWEYACRAGTVSAYYFGDVFSKGMFNVSYLANEDGEEWVSPGKTTAVDAYKPNPWGIYDLHGNVYEWCRNGKYDYGKEREPLYVDLYPCAPRMLRGGAYNTDPWACRSAHRYCYDNARYAFRPGIRLVITPKFKNEDVPQKNNWKKNKIGYITLQGKVNMELVVIPEGTFIMGSPESEERRDKDETMHRVILSLPFLMSQYPVTQEQYQAVMGENPSMQKNNTFPVTNVSWENAREFCRRINEADGFEGMREKFKVDLPTEAQWEYACRADAITPFNNALDMLSADGYCDNLDKLGWYAGNSGRKLHSVGLKRPNPWGLYDMHGNVYEWCRDACFSEGDEVRTSTYHGNQTDPLSETGDKHILRGGSYIDVPHKCRAADRYAQKNGADFVGFRIVLLPKADAFLEDDAEEEE